MIGILCPITSRGCPDAIEEQPIFKALIPSMDALELWRSVTLYIGHDSDDPIWSDPKAREAVRKPVAWIELHALKKNITACFNWLDREARVCDYLIPANDDLAFQTSPLLAVETLRARDDFGTVAFHDEAFPGLPTFYMVGRKHFDIFDVLYPVPWTGAHQDSWIADVYRPWNASAIDPQIKVHNHIGAGTRFEYGPTDGYRDAVMRGRKRVRDYRREQMSDDELAAVPMCIEGT